MSAAVALAEWAAAVKFATAPSGMSAVRLRVWPGAAARDWLARYASMADSTLRGTGTLPQ
jgi:hypothetical protein